jgi:hypothetical protein
MWRTDGTTMTDVNYGEALLSQKGGWTLQEMGAQNCTMHASEFSKGGSDAAQTILIIKSDV